MDYGRRRLRSATRKDHATNALLQDANRQKASAPDGCDESSIVSSIRRVLAMLAVSMCALARSGAGESIRMVPSSFGRAASGEATSGTLTILITGLRSDDGRVGAALYESPLGFPFRADRATQTAFGEIHNRRSLVTFGDVRPGIYAVAVFHDENGNGKLDRNWFGFPVERTAVSNNPRRHIHKPTFDQARFQMQGSFCIEIRFQ